MKKKTKKHQQKKQIHIHCEFPTEKDLDWMETAVQRHTGGFKEWWNDNKDKVSGREFMKIFISVWEAGRERKDK